jgi:trehalose 2-sulfotransferase
VSNAIMSSLFGEQYDYPCNDRTPRTQLMIASIPRSGSTAFCNDLWNTGVLGAPMEYLNLKWVERNGRWRDKLGDLAEYWRAVQSVRTSPNGIFSYKMFAPNYFTVLERCPEFLPTLVPTHIVFFTRDDAIAQAVSYAKAIETQQWFHGTERTEPEYDRQLVDNALEKIVDQKRQWEKIFELTGAQQRVLRISYEDYLLDKEAVLAKVMRFVLGSGEGRQTLGMPSIDVQRDISSFRWIGRYLDELHQPSGMTSSTESRESGKFSC